MRILARLVSALALLVTIGAPLLFLWGRLELPEVKAWMLVSSIGWFATAPLWMDRKEG
jgi:hypothetical protein